MKIKNNKGYSLVEVLVVVMIFALVGTMIVGFLTTSLTAYTGSKNEINAQSEAQTTANWLNDMLCEAGYGIKYDDVGTTRTLEIYNENNYYTVVYTSSDQQLNCFETLVDSSSGTTSPGAQNQLLAENVTDFSLDLSKLSADNPVLTLTLKVDKGDRIIDLVRNVTLRNGVEVNKPAEEVYAEVAPLVSSVNQVTVYPTESYHARGTMTQFSARVTGVGFPSQAVKWSIDGSPTGALTKIDEDTGVLTIDANEDADSFRVVATSVQDNVPSDATCGIVKVMKINGVTIDNPGVLDVPGAYALSANVEFDEGSYSNDLAKTVTWSIEEDSRYEGVSISSDGTLFLGTKLYNVFTTQEDRLTAYIKVRATSVADTTKTTSLPIQIKFSSESMNFGDSTVYQLDRNDSLDLSSKLSSPLLSNKNMTLSWSIVNDAGLGNKVKLDKTTGIITASKDINYNSEYALDVKVTMTAAGETTPFAVETVKVYIPKVTIKMDPNTCSIPKGSSGRIPFMVNGLKATDADMQVASAPAVRNTLLYVQNNQLVVSVGTDVKVSEFKTILSIKGNSGISDSGTILVGGGLLSGEENNYGNVEDVVVYAPVPGEDTDAPSMDRIKQATRLFDGREALSNWATLEVARTPIAGGNANVTDMSEKSYICVKYTGSGEAPDLVFQDWDSQNAGWVKIEPSTTVSLGNSTYYAIFYYEDIVAAFGSDFTKADAVCINGPANTVTVQTVDLVIEGKGGTTTCYNGDYRLSDGKWHLFAYTTAATDAPAGTNLVDLTGMGSGSYIYITYTRGNSYNQLRMALNGTDDRWKELDPSETGNVNGSNNTYYAIYSYDAMRSAFGSDFEHIAKINIASFSSQFSIKSMQVVISDGAPTYPSVTLSNGATATYYYDYARDRRTMVIGNGARYYYTEVANSSIVWYRSNVENEFVYVPVPGSSKFPTQFEADNTATIVYQGEKITYKKEVATNGDISYWYFDNLKGIWYLYSTETYNWVIGN